MGREYGKIRGFRLNGDSMYVFIVTKESMQSDRRICIDVYRKREDADYIAKTLNEVADPTRWKYYVEEYRVREDTFPIF